MDISQLLMGARRLLVKNSPAILTGLAVSGVVTTAVMAVKATPNAMRDIWHAESEEDRVLEPLEVVKLTWQYYIPSALMGGATIACIVSANTVSTRRNAALAGLVSLTESSFREYKEKVVETVGEKKELAVRDAVSKDRLEKNPVENAEVFITGLGEKLCYDMFTGRYFRSDIEMLRRAENTINAMMIHGQYATLNEFYSQIGLEPIPQGENVGWNSDRLMELQLSSHLAASGDPCISMDFKQAPFIDFYKIG